MACAKEGFFAEQFDFATMTTPDRVNYSVYRVVLYFSYGAQFFSQTDEDEEKHFNELTTGVS